MHFVIGGACNGKAKWVTTHYENCQYSKESWIRAYEISLSDGLHVESHTSLLVVEGIEYWIRELSLEHESDEVRRVWSKMLKKWAGWEKDGWKRKVVLIGSDITRGIVPVEKIDRKWRDDVGWTFQDTVEECDRVDHIWYGISQRLK